MTIITQPGVGDSMLDTYMRLAATMINRPGVRNVIFVQEPDVAVPRCVSRLEKMYRFSQDPTKPLSAHFLVTTAAGPLFFSYLLYSILLLAPEHAWCDRSDGMRSSA